MTDPRPDFTRLSEFVAKARVELFSPDHSVRVVVGPGGAVHDVELTSRVLKYPADEVGPLVLEVLREAEKQMNQEVAEVMSEIAGERMPARTDHLAAMPTPADVERELRTMKEAR